MLGIWLYDIKWPYDSMTSPHYCQHGIQIVSILERLRTIGNSKPINYIHPSKQEAGAITLVRNPPPPNRTQRERNSGKLSTSARG